MANPDAPRAQRPTVEEVARVAGVSVGTVSHVISGSRPVAPQTRQRVEAAIKQVGYRPNRIAQALIRNETRTIGIVIPDIANPFFAEVIRGAADVLEGAGFAVIIGNSDNLPVKEVRLLREFAERQADGIIVVPATDADASVIAELDGQPVVLVDRVTPGWRGDTVVGYDTYGMGLAVEHLVTLGHRRIAMVNAGPQLSTARARRIGFENAIREHNLQPSAILEGAFTLASGRELSRGLLTSCEPPTAICCGNDLLALGTLQVASELHIRVPADLSVVGYDDIAFAELASPSLTSVSQSGQAMGGIAARLLLERLGDPHGTRQEISVRGSLVVRQSTGPSPSRGRPPQPF